MSRVKGVLQADISYDEKPVKEYLKGRTTTLDGEVTDARYRSIPTNPNPEFYNNKRGGPRKEMTYQEAQKDCPTVEEQYPGDLTEIDEISDAMGPCLASTEDYDTASHGNQTYARSDGSLVMLFKEIGTKPPLSREEEVRLFTRYNHDKDEKTYKEIIESNIKLVISISRKYQGRGIELTDLIGEGCVGMIHAIDKFEPKKGCKFSTYATWWIKQRLTRAIAEKSRNIRLPIHACEILSKFRKYAQANPQMNQESMILGFLGNHKKDEAALRDILAQSDNTLSLDQMAQTETSRTLIESIKPEGERPVGERLATVSLTKQLLSTLQESDAAVIRMRFGIVDDDDPRGVADAPMTLEAIGDRIGVSRERVRQREARAIERMKKNVQLVNLMYGKGHLDRSAIK